MGGLAKKLPATYWTFVVATLALAGIPPLAGFFSKDEILGKVFAAGSADLGGFGKVYLGLWVLGVAGAFLTAFYMFRLVHLTFHGSFRGTREQEHHLHEAPASMVWPLRILAVGSAVVGFAGIGTALTPGRDLNWFEHFLHPVAPALELHHHVPLSIEWLLIGLSVAVAVAGILLARRFYLGPRAMEIPNAIAARFPRAFDLVANKYYVDEAYEATAIAGTVALANGSASFDERVVDGAVNGTAWTTRATSFFSGFFDLNVVDGLVNLLAAFYGWGSRVLRRAQLGVVQGYVLVMALGFVLMVAAALWLGGAL
jgi:NADH-quinone oxidoreductase subunit L